MFISRINKKDAQINDFMYNVFIKGEIAMIKKLVQLRKSVYVLLTIEVLLILCIVFLFRNFLSIILAIYILIKNIICAGVLFYTTKIIVDTNYSVEEALDTDSKNALIFGGIGLIKYDENRNIVWVSDLFYEQGLRIVGKKLLEWQPLLAALFEDEDIKTIDINSRKYQVYNSRDSRLLLLKDVTDLDTILKENEDQQLCIAYITIDNYNDTIEYAEEQKAAFIQTTARQILFNWAKENGIILKKYKEDGYLAVFNERIYRKQVEDKFKILDIFKKKIEDIGEFMALSMGIGRGSKLFRELDEMAFNAISLSYSRGGDQVAVKTLDEDIRYFGGNSQGSEKSSRVRARVISQTLISLIKQSHHVFIMGHKQSDFDSFGASIAIATLAKAYETEANIVLDFNSLEEKTANIAQRLRNEEKYKNLFVSPVRALEIAEENSLLIVVDNHKPSLAISDVLLDVIDKKVVIDHHRRGEEFVDLPILTYLEPAASSTVELIVELFEYSKINVEISALEATIMYAGMLIDTNNFRTRVGARTFQAAAKLREMNANVCQAYEFLQNDYKTTQEILSVSSSAYPFGKDILIAYGKDDEIYDRTLLAKVGNELLDVSDIKAVFVVGKTTTDQISISARSKTDVNVQLIMEELGGGGHFSMAATQIDETDIKVVLNRLEEAIDHYLDGRNGE